jgi:hypothetical protein
MKRSVTSAVKASGESVARECREKVLELSAVLLVLV